MKRMNEWLAVAIGVVTLGVALGSQACKECDPDAFRCAGSTLEICNADGRWMHHTDCKEIYSMAGETPWVCCKDTDAGPECVPEEECQ